MVKLLQQNEQGVGTYSLVTEETKQREMVGEKGDSLIRNWDSSLHAFQNTTILWWQEAK